MKRAVLGVIAVLSLALGVSVAQAHGRGHWGHWTGDQGQASSSVVAVAGVITSVDPSTSSFGANAFVPQGEGFHTGQGDQGSGDHHFGGSGGAGGFHRDFMPGGDQSMQPTLTPVTITTNAATTFRVTGQEGDSPTGDQGSTSTATLANLAPGDRFVALFNGSPTDSLQTLVASPAVAVFAHAPRMQHQLYAFVGTVSAVNATASTVSVTVSNSIPSGLVPAGSGPQTFTVSPSTLILGGTSPTGLFGGLLSDVSVGDVVAGGLIGTAGETLTQVESSPLQVLVDFPAATTSTTTSSSVRRATRQRALNRALSLFGVKARTTTGKGHKARHRKTHAHHGRRGTSRTRTAHATRARR